MILLILNILQELLLVAGEDSNIGNESDSDLDYDDLDDLAVSRLFIFIVI